MVLGSQGPFILHIYIYIFEFFSFFMDAEGPADTSGLSTARLFDGIATRGHSLPLINVATPWSPFWRTSQTCYQFP
jgi:hypothetical protein